MATINKFQNGRHNNTEKCETLVFILCTSGRFQKYIVLLISPQKTKLHNEPAYILHPHRFDKILNMAVRSTYLITYITLRKSFYTCSFENYTYMSGKSCVTPRGFSLLLVQYLTCIWSIYILVMLLQTLQSTY
jgi:hypothetical protein